MPPVRVGADHRPADRPWVRFVISLLRIDLAASLLSGVQGRRVGIWRIINELCLDQVVGRRPKRAARRAAPANKKDPPTHPKSPVLAPCGVSFRGCCKSGPEEVAQQRYNSCTTRAPSKGPPRTNSGPAARLSRQPRHFTIRRRQWQCRGLCPVLRIPRGAQARRAEEFRVQVSEGGVLHRTLIFEGLSLLPSHAGLG